LIHRGALQKDSVIMQKSKIRGEPQKSATKKKTQNFSAMPCTKKTNAVCHKKNCGISQASKNDVFCPSFQWLAAKNKHSVSNGKKKAAGRKLENFPMQQKKNKISQCKQEKLWHLAKGK
jgi:hypothetical protein